VHECRFAMRAARRSGTAQHQNEAAVNWAGSQNRGGQKGTGRRAGRPTNQSVIGRGGGVGLWTKPRELIPRSFQSGAALRSRGRRERAESNDGEVLNDGRVSRQTGNPNVLVLVCQVGDEKT